MSRILAPFSDEQVESLKAWQKGEGSQNTVCLCDAEDKSKCPENGILIPHKYGFLCPCGRYTQKWCHDYMVEGAEMSLMQRTTEMLKHATLKGYVMDKGLIKPIMSEWWHDQEVIFCNTACSIIAWWLRTKNIDITITRYRNDASKMSLSIYKWYGCMYENDYLVFDTFTMELQETYEHAWLDAINFCLNYLPSTP